MKARQQHALRLACPKRATGLGSHVPHS